MIRSLRTRIVIVLALLASLAPTVGASAAVAAAAPVPNTSMALDLDEFHQVLLDEANGHLFYRDRDRILVTDLNGNRIRHINNVGGVGDMAMSEDGTTLWVGLFDDHRVLRITTADLTKNGTLRLPDDVCPVSVAETNGKLVVGHECDSVSRGLGVVDLADESWTASTDPAASTNDPLVVTSPGAPDIAVVGARSQSPVYVRIFDVSTLDATYVGGASDGSNLADLAIRPQGDVVVQASGTPYTFPAWELADGSKWKAYAASPNPRAVAWSGDGNVLAGGLNSNENVRVYKAGAKTAKLVHTGYDIAPRGLAVDATGAIVWAVAEVGADYELLVLPGFGWGKCKGKFPTIVGTDGDDLIHGTRHDDVILAGDGDDTIYGKDGDDTICGQGGDDFIEPDDQDGYDDVVHGGGGRDTISFANFVVGRFGVTVDLPNRTATQQGGDIVQNIENVYGSYGDDTIIGNGKANVLEGNDGNDTIYGGGKNDTIDGQYGDDYVEGGFGNDKIYGGDGNDLLIGDGGNDILLGQDGDDTLAGVAGDDTLKGGAGDDTASFAISANGVTASLLTKTATGEGSDTLNAIEWIVGTEHDDRLTGNGSINLMESRGGDDRLDGDSNDDTLYGGTGTDTLIGGSGYDYCLDGESHSSCEFIGTTAVVANDLPWSLNVLGDAVRFLPTVELR